MRSRQPNEYLDAGWAMTTGFGFRVIFGLGMVVAFAIGPAGVGKLGDPQAVSAIRVTDAASTASTVRSRDAVMLTFWWSSRRADMGVMYPICRKGAVAHRVPPP